MQKLTMRICKCGEYLRKGSKVYIEGKLETRKWQAQDGTDRYSTDIKAFQMQMLDSKGDQSSATPAPGTADLGLADPDYYDSEFPF